MLPTDDRSHALQRSAGLSRYLDEVCEQRRRNPQDDLISTLVVAQEDEVGLTDDELRGMLLHLLVAGNETTTALLGHLLVALEADPVLRADLRGRPDLVVGAVEEALRFEAPIQFLTRQTTRELELHGQTVPSGALVSLVLGSANRDPERFANPDAFIADRDDNQHASFGWGPHFCIGAPLSRLEGQIVVDLLANDFADVARTAEPGVLKPDQLIRGYRVLSATMVGAGR
jgi:cytochrome P450 family 109